MRCSRVNVDPSFCTEDVFSLSDIDKLNRLVSTALYKLPSWERSSAVTNALYALTAQAELAVQYAYQMQNNKQT